MCSNTIEHIPINLFMFKLLTNLQTVIQYSLPHLVYSHQVGCTRELISIHRFYKAVALNDAVHVSECMREDRLGYLHVYTCLVSASTIVCGHLINSISWYN